MIALDDEYARMRMRITRGTGKDETNDKTPLEYNTTLDACSG